MSSTSAIALTVVGLLAGLSGGCGPDGVPFVAIEEFRMEPNSLEAGESTEVSWRVRKHAHSEILYWVTLFHGTVPDDGADAGETKTGLATYRGESGFVCTYSADRRFGCLDPERPENRLPSMVLPQGLATFTLRACLLGTDGEAEASVHQVCDYETLEITLR